MDGGFVPRLRDGTEQTLRAQGLPALAVLQRGIEKESLRVAPSGALSQRPHPQALGSPLTHPQITTDFSEAQLELITGVHDTPQGCLDELRDVHRFVHASIDDELLWPASMPCLLPGEAEIPLGQYGTSNVAQSKTVYRRGLANRYGATMQTISGIHYNFSVPDELLSTLGIDDIDAKTAAYFGLIRNFRRYSWLLIYLFGASPAICKSFATSQAAHLDTFDEGSLYLPHATSLRMGPLGYQSDAQRGLHMSYNSLADYAQTMRIALTEPVADYEAIGTLVDGEYQQLNTTLIQIENEFYGSIRPKNPVNPGERPLTALTNRGVAYVEVRCLDLNPFLELGIDAAQIRFIDTFLLYCLLTDSPDDSPEESARMHTNQVAVVQNGRDPQQEIDLGDHRVRLPVLADELLTACEPIARLLDEATNSADYTQALADQRQRVANPETTPSAQILALMSENAEPFFRLAMNQANRHRGAFDADPLDPETLRRHSERAAQSLTRQSEIEAADTIDFATYLEQYLALP